MSERKEGQMLGIHRSHCDRDLYEGACKYGDDDCPVMAAKTSNPAVDGESLARRFHETYERLAPSFGYETRADTRAFDPDSANGRLMIAVCAELSVIPKQSEALNRIADLGSCSNGKTPAYKLFQQAIDIATGAL
jgi:hypothetical protein